MNYAFLIDESSWDTLLKILLKEEVVEQDKTRLDFIDLTDKDINNRCKEIAYRIVFKKLPFLNRNSLSLIKDSSLGRISQIPPALPKTWRKRLNSEIDNIPSTWKVSNLLFRILILFYHLNNASLIRFIYVNLFKRKRPKPCADSPILLDFPKEAQYINNNKRSKKYYSLLQNLLDHKLIDKDKRIFSRLNTSLQTRYQFPYHSIKASRFWFFLIKAIRYELLFLISIFKPKENKILFLIDDIIEYIYLKSDNKAPYRNLYKTISSHHCTNTLSQLPARSNNQPLAYTNLVYYSQNDRLIAFNSDKSFLSYDYESFPYYSVITWTKEHALFLKSISNYKPIFKYSYLGYLDFVDKLIEIPSFDNLKNKVLLFPVEPKLIDYSYYYGFPMGSIHNCKSHITRFLEDLCQVSKDFDLNIIVKNKRDDFPNKEYLSTKYNFLFLPPGVSARRAIESIKPKLIISSPFTSAALYEPKRSIYYYPNTEIKLGAGYNLESIPFIVGRKSLYAYISSIIGKE
ncbi:hypothetical protein [Prochlorococcus sp. MIT 1223]|uniref:hypothetical protein n=1 Tax=Prochlorococcus sp. MIT 1223 TaxID=3096217 RepID=UPI002A763433|nr:hypothetical protein [Prochlorococcus sp. MIT 1223]